MNAITIGTNIVWGQLGDRYGWMRQMRWFGFCGMALAVLAFAYIPVWFGPSFPLMIVAVVLFALSVTAFVPTGATSRHSPLSTAERRSLPTTSPPD